MAALPTAAVIFDVDGVLVDSYNAHRNGWMRLANELGVPYSEPEFLRDFGRTAREVLTEVFAPHCALLTPDKIPEVEDRKEALYREEVDIDFPAMDGALHLIESLLAAGIKVGVGSSGPPENVALVLRHLGITDRIHAAVNGSEVPRGKPDPAIFLTAASRMGVDPKHCVVIEDARPGLKAARAAGMKCIALVSTGHTPEELSEADEVVAFLREVTPDRIRQLLTK